MQPTTMLRIDRTDFVPFLKEHPDLCVAMIELLCERLRWVSDNVEDAVFLDIPNRLAKRLFVLMENHGVPVDDGIRLDLKLSQESLAQMLGATRESVNKGLRSLQDRGIVRYYYGEVVILDVPGLRFVVEGQQSLCQSAIA